MANMFALKNALSLCFRSAKCLPCPRILSPTKMNMFLRCYNSAKKLRDKQILYPTQQQPQTRLSSLWNFTKILLPSEETNLLNVFKRGKKSGGGGKKDDCKPKKKKDPCAKKKKKKDPCAKKKKKVDPCAKKKKKVDPCAKKKKKVDPCAKKKKKVDPCAKKKKKVDPCAKKKKKVDPCAKKKKPPAKKKAAFKKADDQCEKLRKKNQDPCAKKKEKKKKPIKKKVDPCAKKKKKVDPCAKKKKVDPCAKKKKVDPCAKKKKKVDPCAKKKKKVDPCAKKKVDPCAKKKKKEKKKKPVKKKEDPCAKKKKVDPCAKKKKKVDPCAKKKKKVDPCAKKKKKVDPCAKKKKKVDPCAKKKKKVDPCAKKKKKVDPCAKKKKKVDPCAKKKEDPCAKKDKPKKEKKKKPKKDASAKKVKKPDCDKKDKKKGKDKKVKDKKSKDKKVKGKKGKKGDKKKRISMAKKGKKCAKDKTGGPCGKKGKKGKGKKKAKKGGVCGKKQYRPNLAAVLHGAEDLRLERRPVHKVSGTDVLVAIDCVGLSDADVQYMENGKIGTNVLKKPMVIGHEASGIITDVGKGVKHLKEGDRVAIEPGVPCNACPYCRKGLYNLCPKMKFCATPPIDGNMSRYFKHPAEYCHKIPKHVTMEEGALMEPLALGCAVCRRANLKLGQSLLIMGAGPVGLMTLLTAKASGASQIFIIDKRKDRLELARKLGATAMIMCPGYTAQDMVQQIRERMGSLPDNVIDCEGSCATTRLGIFSTRSGGTFVIFGLPTEEGPLPLVNALSREVDIRGVRGYCGDYPTAVGLMSSGTINDLKYMVTHHYMLEETHNAFECMRGNKKAMKVIVHVQERDKNNKKPFDSFKVKSYDD